MSSGNNVSIIGLGKLGLPMAACLARKGYHVWAHDANPRIMEALRQSRSPYHEMGLPALMLRHRRRLHAVEAVDELVRRSDITFIVVATPSRPDGRFSNEYVLAVCRELGRALRAKKGRHLVVLVSTVSPGTLESEVIPCLERASGRRAGSARLGFCYNPEFIALGRVIHDLSHPDFVLIGESDRHAGDQLARVYGRFLDNDAPLVRMNLMNAQIAKLALNMFVTMKVSYSNLLARLCERLPGADVDTVTAAVGADRRVGRLYLKGGTRFGGPCFPRDVRAMSHLMRSCRMVDHIPAATMAVNRAQDAHLFSAVKRHLGARGRVAVLGVTYKPDTDVIDESAGLALAASLKKAGVRFIVHDAAAALRAAQLLGSGAVTASLAEAVYRSDVIVVTVPAPAYARLPSLLARTGRRHVVIDPWRMFKEGRFGARVRLVPMGRAV